jgi:hypothetical protein
MFMLRLYYLELARIGLGKSLETRISWTNSSTAR